MYKFAFIEPAVKWAGGFRCTVFSGCNGCYSNVIFIIFRMTERDCLTKDFFCKIIPANITTFIGDMVLAVFFAFSHINKKSCQVKGVGWCSNLVINDGKFVMIFADSEHGLNKVFAISTEYPCNADNKIFV